MKNVKHDDKGYSIENAIRFHWGSFSENLSEERMSFLRQYVIGPRVLDAGCGGGGYVNFLANEGFDAVGVDKFDFFLANSQKNAFRGTFLLADLTEKLPFEDKTFDTTCCIDVLEHIDDRAAIRELARITRKRLILAVPQKDQWFQRFGLVFATYRDTTHLRYYTRESLADLADSIAPKSVKVMGEYQIEIRWLSKRFLIPESRRPGLTKVYQWLFHFLLLRCRNQEIHMNLAAVIDLQ